MPVNIEHIDPNTVRLTVEIPAAEIEAAFNEELRKQRGQVRIRGFRPGKVPLALLKGYVGRQVMADVTADLMQQALLKTVEEHQLHVASAPKLDHTPQEPGGPLQFTATLEIHEAPREIDLAGLKAHRTVAPVEDAAVDEQLERLRELHARTIPIDPPRAALKGDVARMDYTLRFDDKPDQEPLVREGIEIEVGGQYVLDEIAEALAGMKPAEEKDVKLSFPAEYHLAAFAGRTAQVHLKLVDLSQRQVPKLDDDFAREVGESDLAALRTKVRTELETEATRTADTEVERELLDAIVERAHVALPPTWLKEQLDERVAGFQRTFGGGRDLGEQETASLRTEIERQLRRMVVVAWVARQKNCEATPEQVEERLTQVAQGMNRPLPAVKAEFARKGTASLEADLTERNVLKVLREAATIEDRAPEPAPESK